ncbi:unnamed protein product [Rhodiola kirilowii]
MQIILGLTLANFQCDKREESKRPEIGYTRVGAGKQM